MALADPIRWHLDCNTYGGVVHERLLAAITVAEGIYAGLIFTFESAGHPTIAYWDRIDDLERGGVAPLSASRARAICHVLPRFLDRLESTQREGQQEQEQDADKEAQ